MIGVIFIIVGATLMSFGVFMLSAWISGTSRWFDAGIFGRSGATKNDRQFLDLYFIAVVLIPLLSGAIMIVFALRGLL